MFSNAMLRTNFQLLSASAGTHPDVPADGPLAAAVLAEMTKSAGDHGDSSHKHGMRQFQFLVLGVVFYTVFHIWAMIVRSL